jgi:hypothetical protein
VLPLVWMIASHNTTAVYPATIPSQDDGRESSGIRASSAGAIATAGIRDCEIAAHRGRFSVSLRAFRVGETASGERTDRDLPIVTILIGVILSAVGVAMFWAISSSPRLCWWGFAGVFSFFFTSVALTRRHHGAQSRVGMTMLTIIISSIVLLRFGLSGTTECSS